MVTDIGEPMDGENMTDIPSLLDGAAKKSFDGLSLILEALRLVGPFEPSEKTETIGVDHEDHYKLIYNDAYMSERSRGEFRYLVMFTALLIPYAQPECLIERDIHEWNIAANFAINGRLAELGFAADMPDGALWDPNYDGLTAEQVYETLTKREEQEPWLRAKSGASHDTSSAS